MEKTILKVEGMSCEHCVKSVTSAVIDLPGVQGIDVSLENKTVQITHDGSTTVQTFKEEIEDQGYDVV